MPNTITEYNTFTQGTKARAAQVNTNFSNYRGTLIPINTDTAMASNLTHDLGTTEHRWANGYIDKIYFSQTTTGWNIQDATTAVGNLQFLLSGTSVAEIGSDGFQRADFGAVNYVLGTTITSNSTNGSRNLDTLTITANGGPIQMGFLHAGTGESYFRGSGPSIGGYKIVFLKDGVTICSMVNYSRNAITLLGSPSSHFFIDFDATAGSHEYSAVVTLATITGDSINAQNLRMFVREL